MKIHNVRLMFAMNSSSTHSVIVIPPNMSVDESWDGDDFGWQDFTLVNPKSKLQYFASILFPKLCDNPPYLNYVREGEEGREEYLKALEERNKIVQRNEEAAAKLMLSEFGLSLEMREEEDCILSSYYRSIDAPTINHQSVTSLPESPDGGVDLEFAKDFLDFLLRSDVVILGGNDNSDGHPLSVDYSDLVSASEAQNTPGSRSDGIRSTHLGGILGGGWSGITRKDGNYWTVFSPHTGSKVRVSFDPDAPKPTKAKAPELVDLKITDYCDLGCAFCYQGSTTKGKHADMAYIKAAIDEMARHRVLEIAIGGGEPTTHPNFIEILRYAREKRIVPNFTTKTLRWLKEPWAKEAQKLCGGFAISISNTDEMRQRLRELGYRYDEAGYRPYWHRTEKALCNITFQHVIGTTTPDDLYEMVMLESYTNLTLLGYKDDERGADFKPLMTHEEAWEVVERVRANNRWLMFGIDTKLAQAWEEHLSDLDTERVTYETEEGKFSCYVDALKRRVEKCSYGPRESHDLADVSNLIPAFVTM